MGGGGRLLVVVSVLPTNSPSRRGLSGDSTLTELTPHWCCSFLTLESRRHLLCSCHWGGGHDSSRFKEEFYPHFVKGPECQSFARHAGWIVLVPKAMLFIGSLELGRKKERKSGWSISKPVRRINSRPEPWNNDSLQAELSSLARCVLLRRRKNGITEEQSGRVFEDHPAQPLLFLTMWTDRELLPKLQWELAAEQKLELKGSWHLLILPSARWPCCCCLLAESCLRLWDPVDGSPPSSSVHGISQQEYWSGLPFSFSGDLPDSEIKPRFPALVGGFFTIWATGDCGTWGEKGQLLGGKAACLILSL